MASRATATSPLVYARVAGFGYLTIFAFSIFANVFVLGKLIVSGDATATADNIIASETLFRLGIASWIVAYTADLIVTWALYILLQPVNRSLSLLAAWFRLVFVAIIGINTLNLFVVLQLAKDTDYAQLTLVLNAYAYGETISFVFFGFHILVLGYLIFKSDYLPRILGLLLIVAALGYIVDSFASFISSSYDDNELTFLLMVAVPAVIAEFSLNLWLLFKGVNVERWKQRALESA